MYQYDTQMVDPTPLRRPIHWEKLRTDEAERVIRERAADTAKVIFSAHAFDRVDDRTISTVDAYRILRTGYVDEPLQKNIHGEWEARVTKRMPGNREAAVVTIVFRQEDELFVKTVMWVDEAG